MRYSWIVSLVFVFLIALSGTPTSAAPRSSEPAPPAPSAELRRFVINQAAHPDAVYNDGSTPLFYYRAGVGSGADKWLFWFKGGGTCYSEETCRGRGPSLTSADPWMRAENETLYIGSPTAPIQPNGILNPDPALNPDFYNWNHVVLVYGSSDSWSGTGEAMIGGKLWYFRGHYIVNAIVDALSDPAVMPPTGIESASQILLTGTSAGAGGLRNNIDRLARYFRTKNPEVDVRGISDAALSPIVDPETAAIVPDMLQARSAAWTPYLDESCFTTAPEAERGYCALGVYLVDNDHLQTEIFYHMDQLDPLTLKNFGLSPCDPADRTYVDAFGAEVRRLVAEEDGGFSPRFGKHVILNVSRFFDRDVKGISMAQAVHNWYFGKGGPTHVIAEPTDDTCSQGHAELRSLYLPDMRR